MSKAEYMTVSEAAREWKRSPRQIQHLCALGAVEGAVHFGRSWMIPRTAKKPLDKRTRAAKTEVAAPSPTLPMPRKSPFLDMTDLYVSPGTADGVIASLEGNPEAQALFSAEIAYSRGEIDKVVSHASEFLCAHSGFYAINAGGMLLALAAMWHGDIALYRQAKIHICESPWQSAEDKQIMSLSLACIDTAVRDLSYEGYPEWFRYGRFEHLHPDSHPAAKVFYVKYLLVAAQEHAKGRFPLPDVSGMGLMRMLPYIAEPLLSRVVADHLVIPEIYLRLLVSIAYHQLGDDASAILHIDKAIDLALPDRLLGILAEHRRNLDHLLDDRLLQKDRNAYETYRALHGVLLEGWTTLHNSLLSKNVSKALTTREREIARLAAFGLSNDQIASRLSITVDSVKKAIFRIMNKTGVNKREELGAYV